MQKRFSGFGQIRELCSLENAFILGGLFLILGLWVCVRKLILRDIVTGVLGVGLRGVGSSRCLHCDFKFRLFA